MDFLGWWVVSVGGPIHYLIRPTISSGAPGSTWTIKASLVELIVSIFPSLDLGDDNLGQMLLRSSVSSK